MMTIGDIFYFVDADLGKVTKHKLVSCNGNIVKFSNIKYGASLICIRQNPTPENYFQSYTKFYGTNKSYLIFTEVEDAQQALVDYILPQILEVQQMIADNITKKYHKLIDKVERLENDLIKNKQDFNKKCNVLKAKFV